MSSDEDEEMVERNGCYPGDSTGVLTNLLFGNVNAEGALEDDIFDDQARRSLHQLTQMGVGGLVRELAEECQEETEVDYTQGEKSAAAVDYSDETELADEQLEADDKSRIPKAHRGEAFEGGGQRNGTGAGTGQAPDSSPVTAPLLETHRCCHSDEDRAGTLHVLIFCVRPKRGRPRGSTTKKRHKATPARPP